MTNGQRENTYKKATVERRKKVTKRLETQLDEQTLDLIAAAETVQSTSTNTSVRMKPILRNAIVLAASASGVSAAEFINRTLLEATATKLMRPTNRVGFFDENEEPRPALEFALRCWAADERRSLLRIVDTLGERYLPESQQMMGDALAFLMKRLRERWRELPADDVHDLLLPVWNSIERAVGTSSARRLDHTPLITIANKVIAERQARVGDAS